MKTNNFESAGKWWNDNSIDLVKIAGGVYALHGWNGEKYMNCWKCSGEFNMDASEEEYVITPVYEEVGDDDFRIIGYELV